MTELLDRLMAEDPTTGRRATLCREAATEIARLREAKTALLTSANDTLEELAAAHQAAQGERDDALAEMEAAIGNLDSGTKLLQSERARAERLAGTVAELERVVYRWAAGAHDTKALVDSVDSLLVRVKSIADAALKDRSPPKEGP